jgi:dipeptidyl aminopeptidase/acylaminoacyl peptidase
MRIIWHALAALPFTLSAHAGAQPAGGPLTPTDLLDIRSVTPGEFSSDGAWLTVRVSRRGDALGFVAARDGDPSYTRPSPAQLLVVRTTGTDTARIFPSARTLGTTAWSRNGNQLAIITRDTVPQLFVWDAATRRLRAISLGGARLAENSAVQWTDDGRLAVAVRERGWHDEVRARFDSLVRGPVSVQVATDSFLSWDNLRRLGNRSLVIRVTPGRATIDTLIAATQLIDWSMRADGRGIMWREDRTTHTTYESFTPVESRLWVREDAGSPRVLVASLRGTSGFATSDDGRVAAFARDGAIHVVAATDSAPRRVIGPAPRARGDSTAGRDTSTRYTLTRLSPKGDIVLASSRGSITAVLVERGRTMTLYSARDTISGPRVAVADWSANNMVLLLTVNSRTAWDRALVRWELDGMGPDTIARDSRLYGNVRLSPDGSRMVMTVGSNGHPPDLWVADGKMKAPLRAMRSNPQLEGRALPTTELIRYLDVDGKPQFGVLTKPVGTSGPLPTVFSVYEEFFDDGWDATTMYLASQGFAVMKPSVGFETGYPGEAWLKGVTASANALIERGIADSARLGVHGTSYGGYATNLLVTQTNRFKAAINISGKVDLVSFYTDSPRLGIRNVNAAEKTQDRIGATMWEQPQKYVAHSAVMFADRIRTPLLLMTGGEDHNVPAINTREMYYALRRLGRTVEWINYTNGGHGIPMTTASEFSDWHSRILGWYDRYLRPPRASRPAASGGGSPG